LCKSSILNPQSSILNPQSSISSLKAFARLSSAKKLLAAATLFACSPAFAAQTLTFDFSTLTPTGEVQNSYTLTQSSVTLTINSPSCNSTARNFNVFAGAGLGLETIFGTNNCAAGASSAPNQFNMSFNQSVEFISYVSALWDGGNYEFLIGTATTPASTGNSVTAAAATNFANQPITVNSGTTVLFRMVEPTSGTTNFGGKLKSITVNCPSCGNTTVSAPILTIEKYPPTFATEVK